MSDTAAALAEAVNAAVPHVKAGSLVVFGDIFGGRIDNVHRAVGAVANPDGSVTVGFDGGETLRIWDPAGATVTDLAFRVERASRVRWEWFYYGRDPLPENRYFEEHRVVHGRVEAETDADWYGPTFSPSLARPAVEIVSEVPDVRSAR